MLFQLVYASRAVDPPASVRDDIVEQCRRNNERDGVTGLLLSDGHRYLQALEGDEGAVRACFERITLDRRHYACQLMARHEVEDRQFGSWALAYKSVADARNPGEFTDEVKRELTQVSYPQLLAFFIGFASLSDRR